MTIGCRRIFSRLVYLSAAILLFQAATAFKVAATPNEPAVEVLDVLSAYLKAVHARDPKSAYRLISAADQRIRDEDTYRKSAEAFDTFALALAQKLAAGLKVQLIELHKISNRAKVEVAYEIPTGDEISDQLFGWKAGKLNALSPSEQQRLADAVDELQRRGSRITLRGRETFRLVREPSGWKIFLDWASRTRVVFKSRASPTGELAVQFASNDFLVGGNEPLQINFTVKNHAPYPIIVRLDHSVEPHRFADHVEMIACGSLAPVRMRPREAREFSSSYIVSDVPAKSRVSIVYGFSVTRDR